GCGRFIVELVHLHTWELVDSDGRAVPAPSADEDPDPLLEILAVMGMEEKVAPPSLFVRGCDVGAAAQVLVLHDEIKLDL
ncbi:unnamed protein product, partial [Urochloa humidicola]